MRKRIISLIMLLGFTNIGLGQMEDVLYPIDTLDNYGLTYSQYGDTYSVEGELVTKLFFDSLLQQNIKISECCPCLIRFRSKKDSSIIYEQVKCGRQRVGQYNNYDTLGKISITGFYSNPEDHVISDTLSSGQGDPGNKTGEWIEYDINGQIKSTELWNNGIFISETTDNSNCSIWGYSVSFDGELKRDLTIPLDSLSSLKINLFYKNENKDCKTKIGLNVIVGLKREFIEIDYETFSKVDFRNLFIDKGLLETNVKNVIIMLNLSNTKQQIPPFLIRLTE